eukprot:4462971-Amphidinium_carterae.1
MSEETMRSLTMGTLGWCVKPMTPTLQVLKCGESCAASLLDLRAKILNKSGMVNQHRGVQVRA